MALINFLKGLAANLPRSGAIEDAVYYTTDEKKLYVGNSRGSVDRLCSDADSLGGRTADEYATVEDITSLVTAMTDALDSI